MEKHRWLSVLIIFILASCTGVQTPAASPTNTFHKNQGTILSFVEMTPTSLATGTPTSSRLLNVVTSMPSSSPAPTTSLKTNVIEVNWEKFGSASRYSSINQPEWINNSYAILAAYPSSSGDGHVTVDISVDISKKEPAKAEFYTIYQDRRVFSTHRTYFIECYNGMQMFRVKDMKLIHSTSLLMPLPSGFHCSDVIQWSPDESHASFVDPNNAVYIWANDGTAPKKVMENVSSLYTSWSPNSSELVVVKSVNGQRIGRANILDASGKVLHEFNFQAGGDSIVLGWYTDQILISYSRYDHWYYGKSTGKLLFDWLDMPTGHGIWHQRPQISPDGRWIFIDQGDVCEICTPVGNHFLIKKEYRLYDVLNNKQIELLDFAGNFLGFAGWNDDSSKMYVISRPQEPVSISAPSTPFGLLTYDVKAHKFDLIFKDAVQVEWNPDKSRAFVVFAERDSHGKLGLAGGLWNPATGELTGQWHIWGQMLYQDPALDTFSNVFPGPVPVVWSHDGQRVAVCNASGQVKLFDINGTEHLLTDASTGIGGGSELRWSPDDQHLLIENGYRAWIVDVPVVKPCQ